MPRLLTNIDPPKPKRSTSPRGLCERFGLKAGDMQRMAGETRRTEAVQAARQDILELHPELFSDESSVVDYLISHSHDDSIVQEYRGYLATHGWEKP